MQSYVIALYIRLSIEDCKCDSLSIENQSLVLHEYAASMPEAFRAEVLEFIDNGYTGTNFERPQVQRLIEMVRENRIDCIIVKDFSRFGRNSIETGYFIERVFPLFHTRFISVSDDYDSDNFKGDTGGMDVAFKYLISEYYSRDMSIKTKSAKYARMRRGEYQSKICPYGYRKSADGRMEPDPEAAQVVRLIFEMSVQGINAAAIARELYARNIPTPGEYKAAHGNHTHDISRTHGIWCSSTILRMLEDERYLGTYIIGKRAVTEVGGSHVRMKDRDKWIVIPNHHPALIDRDVFEKSKEKQLRFSLPKKKKGIHPLTGKVVCGCCHHALSRSNGKTPYYYCRHSDADSAIPCYKMRMDAQELEQFVFDRLREQSTALLESASGSDPAIPESSEYERQIEALEDEKMNLYESYLLGEIGLGEYRSQKEKIDAQLLDIQNTLAMLAVQEKQSEERKVQKTAHKTIAQMLAESDTLTKAIAESLIDHVYVYPDKRVEVVFENFSGNAERSKSQKSQAVQPI